MAFTADQNLDPGQWRGLNSRFFASEHGPTAYLQQRLRGLLLAASTDDRVKEATADGLTWGELKLGHPIDSDIYDQAELASFVGLDATVLLHHAAESMMRLYFALADEPSCPWLEIGRLRAGQFNRALQALRDGLADQATQDRLRRVFDGSSTFEEANATAHAHGGTIDRDVWEDTGRGLMRLVDHLTLVLLADGNAYNAAKHGLAVLSGESGVRLGEGDLIDQRGPALTFVELVDGPAPDTKRWSETTTWIEVDRALALVGLTIGRIDQAWSWARLRYTGNAEFHPSGLPSHVIDGVLSGERRYPPGRDWTVTMRSMQVQLAYLEVPPALGGSPTNNA
jgi:hypothetical protein